MEELTDLHMHSYYSGDGEFSPGELVRQCDINGIRITSIADHNSVQANEVGRRAVLRARTTYVSDTEIGCMFRGVSLHVLGHGTNDISHDFICTEDNIRSRVVVAFSQMLCAIRETRFGMITEDTAGLAEEHYRKNQWTGEMFIEALLGKEGYKDHPLLLLYRVGGARGNNLFVNSYRDLYPQGKCCHAKMEYPQLEEVVDTIHRNRGYAVLAHLGVSLEGRAELLGPMLEVGAGGIETFSSHHSQEQVALYHKAAYGRLRMITCGSDYHEKTKSSISVSGHGCTVPYEEMVRQLGYTLGDAERKERNQGTRMKVPGMNGGWIQRHIMKDQGIQSRGMKNQQYGVDLRRRL